MERAPVLATSLSQLVASVKTDEGAVDTTGREGGRSVARSGLDSTPQLAAFRDRSGHAKQPPHGYAFEDEITSRSDCAGESRLSPQARISMSPPVGSRGIGRQSRFVKAAGVVEVLARDPMRRNSQAHLAVARVAEEPPASTPTSLPVGTSSGSTDAQSSTSKADCLKSSVGEAQRGALTMTCQLPRIVRSAQFGGWLRSHPAG